MSDRYVGYFWNVYDQIFSVKEVFDSETVLNDSNYLYCSKSIEDAWEECKAAHNLPNKSFDHYPHGEVKFDLKKHKFSVIGTNKLMHIHSFQKKVIRNFNLPQFVLFKGYTEQD